MFDSVIPKTYNEINSDNYLVNCYKYIAKSKAIHFLFILIEIFMNFFQEIELNLKNVSSDQIKLDLKYIRKITIAFDKIAIIVKLLLISVLFCCFGLLSIIGITYNIICKENRLLTCLLYIIKKEPQINCYGSSL